MSTSIKPIPLCEHTFIVQNDKPVAVIHGAVSLPPGCLIELGDPKRDYIVRRMRLNVSTDATILIDVEPVTA